MLFQAVLNHNSEETPELGSAKAAYISDVVQSRFIGKENDEKLLCWKWLKCLDATVYIQHIEETMTRRNDHVKELQCDAMQ